MEAISNKEYAKQASITMALLAVTISKIVFSICNKKVKFTRHCSGEPVYFLVHLLGAPLVPCPAPAAAPLNLPGSHRLEELSLKHEILVSGVTGEICSE